MLREAKPGARGFTLVEVLVALVIAAMLTAILLGAATTARARLARAEQRRKAVFVARSLLAENAVAAFDREPKSGSTNGLDWTVGQALIRPDPRGKFGLVEIKAAIADGAGHVLLSARTRRLKAVPQS